MRNKLMIAVVFVLGFLSWVPLLFLTYDMLPYSLGWSKDGTLFSIPFVGDVRVSNFGWNLKPQFYHDWVTGHPMEGSSMSAYAYAVFYVPYLLLVLACYLAFHVSKKTVPNDKEES